MNKIYVEVPITTNQTTLSMLNMTLRYSGKNVKIFKSLKNHWLLTYETDYENCAVALSEEEAKEYLMRYDLEAYVRTFWRIGGSLND